MTLALSVFCLLTMLSSGDLSAATEQEKPSLTPSAVAEQTPVQDTYLLEPLGSQTYAAIAKIGGAATTNAFFVIGKEFVVAAGAHMTKEAIDDLHKVIASVTDRPVKYFILAHHHQGYTHIDYDFPKGEDVIMSWQSWQSFNKEVRKPEYQTLFFNEGMTIKAGDITVIVTVIGRGHTDGDLVVYVPEAEAVFASDLLYVNSVGYLASGYMTEWILALDFLEQLGSERIVPGYGPVSSVEEVSEFKEFFKDFLTAILARMERGETLAEIEADFDMPRYRHMDGYEQLIKANLRRAYEDLKSSYSN
jgi:glyoxylase-like metal-dependent hydrolase (beta-lactamase superfamily II)